MTQPGAGWTGGARLRAAISPPTASPQLPGRTRPRRRRPAAAGSCSSSPSSPTAAPRTPRRRPCRSTRACRRSHRLRGQRHGRPPPPRTTSAVAGVQLLRRRRGPWAAEDTTSPLRRHLAHDVVGTNGSHSADRRRARDAAGNQATTSAPVTVTVVQPGAAGHHAADRVGRRRPPPEPRRLRGERHGRAASAADNVGRGRGQFRVDGAGPRQRGHDVARTAVTWTTTSLARTAPHSAAPPVAP